MTDYIVTILLLLIGIVYDAMNKIDRLKKAFPTLTPKQVIGTFISNEWNTFFTAILGAALYELALFIVRTNEVILPNWIEQWGMYALALVWGYASQRVAYKFLQSSEDALAAKADKIKDNV